MGDRCDIRITMRRSDIVRFSEAVGYDNWWNQAEDADGNDIEILMKGGTLPPPKAGSTPTAPATVEEGPSTDTGLNPALKPA